MNWKFKMDYFSKSAGSINVFCCVLVFLFVIIGFFWSIGICLFQRMDESPYKSCLFYWMYIESTEPTHLHSAHYTHTKLETKKALNHFKNAWNKYRAGVHRLYLFSCLTIDYWICSVIKFPKAYNSFHNGNLIWIHAQQQQQQRPQQQNREIGEKWRIRVFCKQRGFNW